MKALPPHQQISSNINVNDLFDELELYGIRYSGALFRGFGFSISEGETFQIIKREDGVMTVSTTHTNATDIADDAARYRWLKSRDLNTIKDGGVFAGMTPDNYIITGDDLDRAVDDGIEKERLASGD